MADAENKIEMLRTELRTRRCECGKKKEVRKAFCARCMQVLGAAEIRGDRYQLDADELTVEMAEAYVRCLAYLAKQAYVADGKLLKWERAA